jgi:ABC-2 type transport system permease protein
MQRQLEYRFSFFMQILAQFIITISEFIGLAALFQGFGNIHGWTLWQVAFFYSMIALGFSISSLFTRGLDITPQLIKSGELDRYFLRPRPVLLQLLGFEFTLRRMGRLIQGIIVFILAVVNLQMHLDALKLLLILWSIMGSVFLFTGLMLGQATLSFWTIEGLEIMNSFTYGGLETGRYTLTVYKGWFRKFFTFVIPLGCVNYYSILHILEIEDPLGSSKLFQGLAPLGGVLFFFLGLFIWRMGLKHYKSTGS